jgi:hypothetical protein
MLARLGCGLLAATLMLAAPVSAQDESPEMVPLQAAALHPAAYDVILVPRPAGATRSRMFNGERWVTLPNRAEAPYARQDTRQDRYRRPQARWPQRNPRWNSQRDATSGYWPRRPVEDDRTGQQRYRTSERRYSTTPW